MNRSPGPTNPPIVAPGTNAVTSHAGSPVDVRARSLCLHGDTPGAVELALLVRRRLQESGVTVEAFA